MTFLVPLSTVLVVNLTYHLEKAANYDYIRKIRRILGYTENHVVSFEVNSGTYYFSFDAGADIALKDHFLQLISWPNNTFDYGKSDAPYS
ncbi:Glyceraldehyde-3-phosphate dehydrogenase [Plecturocebus cupreus]